MKKGILFIAVILLLAGCSKDKAVQTANNDVNSSDAGTDQDNEEANAESGEASTVPGFEFVYQEVSIPMNAEAEPIIKALGEPSAYLEAASCAFQGLDKTYTYSGFELTTYPSEDKDMVSSVYFKDDSVTTDKGIYIGSTRDEVIEAYGEDFTEDSGEMTYTMGASRLAFIIEDDAVAAVTYSAIVEGIND
jgi:hypothetical protein